MERMPKTPCPFMVVFGIMFLFFGYPPSDSELPQGSGYSGAAEAGSGGQDITLQGNRPLSVFLLGHLTASPEIGERPFPFPEQPVRLAL